MDENDMKLLIFVSMYRKVDKLRDNVITWHALSA